MASEKSKSVGRCTLVLNQWHTDQRRDWKRAIKIFRLTIDSTKRCEKCKPCPECSQEEKPTRCQNCLPCVQCERCWAEGPDPIRCAKTGQIIDHNWDKCNRVAYSVRAELSHICEAIEWLTAHRVLVPDTLTSNFHKLRAGFEFGERRIDLAPQGQTRKPGSHKESKHS
jgi:hypothetical protein